MPSKQCSQKKDKTNLRGKKKPHDQRVAESFGKVDK